MIQTGRVSNFLGASSPPRFPKTGVYGRVPIDTPESLETATREALEHRDRLTFSALLSTLLSLTRERRDQTMSVSREKNE